MARIALVTGANGFVGSYLCEHLIEKGWTVRALVRSTSDLRWLPAEGVEKVYGDVTDFASLPAAADGVDTIFHSAGITRASGEAAYNRVNAAGTANIARAAAEARPSPRRIVLVSSLAAGGPSEPRMVRKEEFKVRPISPYGRSKLRGEMELAKHAGKIPWTVIRPTAIYGPRDRGFLTLGHLAKKGRMIELSGPLQRISVVQVKDVARALVLAAESDNAIGRRYYIAYPEPTDWVEICQWMAEVLGTSVRLYTIPRWVILMIAPLMPVVWFLLRRPNPIPQDRIGDLLAASWTCSTRNASADFGFVAEIDTKPGIQEMVRWWMENGWI